MLLVMLLYIPSKYFHDEVRKIAASLIFKAASSECRKLRWKLLELIVNHYLKSSFYIIAY